MARKYTRVEFTFDECEVYPDKYIKELVDDLRPQDMADLIAACGNAEDAIRMSVAFSELVYFYLDDTVALNDQLAGNGNVIAAVVLLAALQLDCDGVLPIVMNDLCVVV